MQEPRTIVLGTRLVTCRSGTLKEKEDTFQYVPLLDGLKSFLCNHEIFDEVIIDVHVPQLM